MSIKRQLRPKDHKFAVINFAARLKREALTEGYEASAGFCISIHVLVVKDEEGNYARAVPHTRAKNASASSSPEEPSHNYLL